MKQQAFELAHEEEWAAFEALLGQLGHGHRFGTPISTEDFPVRYRRVCHHLALARERRYTAAVIRRLNEMSLRGHHALYGARPGLQRTWVRFLLSGFPRLVRANWRSVLLAGALFYLPFFGLPFAIHRNPEVAYLLQDPQSLARMEEMYRSGTEKFGRKDASDTDMYMFGFYIWNNIRITFQVFASGLLLGLGSIFFLLVNGLQGGAVAGHLTRMGLGENFWSFVITHGAPEMMALVLAGAAGLKLGFALLSPGRKTRLQSLKDAARNGIAIVYGAALLDVLAAFLEAFWSSSALVSASVKFAVGGSLWALMSVYFLLAGRRYV
jgi:uncharacterized membrane protein SpoIIM required for sporulation